MKTRKNVKSRRNRRKSTKSRCRKHRYTRKGGFGPTSVSDELERWRIVEERLQKFAEQKHELPADLNKTVSEIKGLIKEKFLHLCTLKTPII